MHSHRLIYPPTLVLALSMLTGPSWAVLTEAEAVRLALTRPEFSELQQARLDEAEADVLEAETWANPTLELSQDRLDTTREQTWQIAQPLDLSGRRARRTEAAHHRLRATEADNAANQSERIAELRRTFHELLYQQKVVAAVTSWAGHFGEIHRVVDKLSRAGEVSGYDRRRLAREQQNANARLAEVRTEREHARARLSALLAQKHILSNDDEAGGELLPDAPPPLPDLQARLARRPGFTALEERAEAAQSEHLASQRKLPELTLGIGGKRSDDGLKRDKGNTVLLSFSLPLFDRQQAADRRSAAQARAARAELGIARQQAQGELNGLHARLTQLIATAKHYRSEAVAPSAELVRIAEAAYRAGESSVLELLDAYKGALDTELTALDLEAKARTASIELDHLTGQTTQ